MKGRSDIRVEFRDPPPNSGLAATAYIVFTRGSLEGLQLKCAIWEGVEGYWVTGPRTRQDNGKYFDLLQEHESAPRGARKRLYDFILKEFEKGSR